MNESVKHVSAKLNFARWIELVKKRAWIALVLLFALAALAYLASKNWKTEIPRDLAEHSELQLNLSEPDALIESRSLSKLPRDLLEIPVLRDTLTEDFVFYYESNPDRLGIAGSLRRIIYEHDLQLQDELINQLLDEPATVALWRGGTGKLAHVMLLIERNGLSRLLETLAKVALDDSRLTVAGELHVDGDELRLFRLQYAPERSVLFASHDDQLVVLSDARMLLENTSKSAKLAKDAVAGLESVLEGDTSLAEHFGLDESAAEHRITLSADYISMGYRAFFPALAGFTLEKDKTGWHSQLAFDPVDDARKLDFTAIWRSMPMGASACAAVPISSELPGKLAQRLGASKDQQKVIEAHLKGPAGVCWYASSRLYTPLIITRSSSDRIEELDAVSGNLFEQMIGGIERNFGRRFPVQSTNLANGKRWQRMVGSDFGQYPAEQAMDPSVLKSTGFFSVSLARQADMLIFSLDDKLVDQALATLAKSYPPLLDQLPKDRIVPFYLAPQALAPLIRAEALESLPDDLEAVFRNAAETHLFPKLEKFKAFGKFAVTLPAGTEPDDEWEWIAITWQPL